MKSTDRKWEHRERMERVHGEYREHREGIGSTGRE